MPNRKEDISEAVAEGIAKFVDRKEQERRKQEEVIRSQAERIGRFAESQDDETTRHRVYAVVAIIGFFATMAALLIWYVSQFSPAAFV